jgi:hypothetical protein
MTVESAPKACCRCTYQGAATTTRWDGSTWCWSCWADRVWRSSSPEPGAPAAPGTAAHAQAPATSPAETHIAVAAPPVCPQCRRTLAPVSDRVLSWTKNVEGHYVCALCERDTLKTVDTCVDCGLTHLDEPSVITRYDGAPRCNDCEQKRALPPCDKAAPTRGGMKFDEGKIRHELLPLKVLRGVAEVLTFGAKKYDDDSWQSVPDALRRYRAAEQRHFDHVVLDGETTDKDSGLMHAWHYACNALFVAWLLAYKPEQVADYRSKQ